MELFLSILPYDNMYFPRQSNFDSILCLEYIEGVGVKIVFQHIPSIFHFF
jgi:hypothetical protein